MKQADLIDHSKVQEILNQLDFFKHFTADEKKAFIASSNHVVGCEPDEQLIKEGDTDASFFILLWGTVSVLKADRPTPLAQLGPGEFFGEITFLTNTPRTTSVVADGKLLAIKIDQELLSELGAEIREKIKDRIIEKLVERLDNMNKLFAKLA